MTVGAPPVPIRRGYAPTPTGEVHYASAGFGDPVLLLHQTPRSWAEYRHVLPLLGRDFRAIAMDTPGMGDSTPVPGTATIEAYAGAAAAFLGALGIARAAVVGHHTGGVIAVELAAAHPELVSALVLSSTPCTDADWRERNRDRPPVDEVEPSGDGSHLRALWGKRQGFYPPGRPDLLTAFVLDALKAGDPEGGHHAVRAYHMEERLPRIAAPTLLVGATDDPFAFPELPRLAARLPAAEVVEIPGGMVPLPDQLPEAFTDAVTDFLRRA